MNVLTNSKNVLFVLSRSTTKKMYKRKKKTVKIAVFISYVHRTSWSFFRIQNPFIISFKINELVDVPLYIYYYAIRE